MAAIDTDPEMLRSALIESEEWMQRKLVPFKHLIDRMGGRWYRNMTPVDSSGESAAGMDLGLANHEFELLSLMLPSVVFNNPKVKIDTTMQLAEDEAEALMLAMNRWIKDVDLRKELKILATDYLLMWCVALVTQQPTPGGEETMGVGGKFRRGVPYRPLVTRIDPYMFFIDPLAKRLEDAEFVGHKLKESRETLLAWAEADPEGGWNIEGIKALEENSGVDTVNSEKDSGYGERDEIVYREVWIPSAQIEGYHVEEGFHGSIHTLAWDEGDGDEEKKAYAIRAPRPYFGPATGPYRIGGQYFVPNETLPLSSPIATKGLTDALNRQKAAALRQAEQYKNITVFDEISTEMAQKLRDTPDGNAVIIPGFKKDGAMTYEHGGITDVWMAQIAMLQSDLDRVSGINDANRGVVTGEGTATEVAVADQSNDMRSSWIIEQFVSFTEDLLLDVAYLMHHSDVVAFPLGMETAQMLGMEPAMIMTPSGPALIPPDPWFHGGMSTMPFNRLQLSIEAYSMQRTSPALQQQQLMMVTNMVTTVAPQMPLMPFINWNEYLQFVAQISNTPELHKIIDVEMLALMTQNALMMQKMQMQQPMMAQDMMGGGGAMGGGALSAPQPMKLGSGNGSSGTSGKTNRPMGNGQRADQPRKNQGTSGRSQGQFAKSSKGL